MDDLRKQLEATLKAAINDSDSDIVVALKDMRIDDANREILILIEYKDHSNESLNHYYNLTTKIQDKLTTRYKKYFPLINPSFNNEAISAAT